MRIRLEFVVSMVLAAMFPACAVEGDAADDRSGDDDNAAAVAAKANAVAVECLKLDEPARCLGDKASERLQKQLANVESDLKKQGLLGDSAEKVLPYLVRTMPACIESDPRRTAAVWTQMTAAIDFLSEFHRARRGLPSRWFSDILVCPASQLDQSSPLPGGGFWGGEIRLDATTLQIGVKRGALGGLFGGFDPQDGFEIRKRWDSGEQFAKTSLDDKKGLFRTKIWPVINPVGLVRTQALPAIREGALAFANRLTSLQASKSGLASKRAAAVELVRAETAKEVALSPAAPGTDSPATLGSEAEKRIAAMSEPQLNAMLQSWASFVSSPASADDAQEAVATLQQGAVGRACNVDIKQVCPLVAVNNAHCINVRLNTSSSFIQKFVIEPKREAATNVVKARQFSLVCVQTNDFIDVDTNVPIDINRSMYSAGLARALGIA